MSAALAIALLLLANAFFVASEFAIVKLRPTHVQSLARGGSRRAATLLRITSHLDTYLSANQLGVTLASIALGWIGEPAFASVVDHVLGRWLHSPVAIHGLGTALAFLSITFLHTVLGELAPKSLAIQRTEAVALLCAVPLHVFYLVMYPFIHLLNGSARLILRLFGMQPVNESSEAHSTEELKLVVAASHAHGVLDRSTAELVDHALSFRSRPVRTVMTPRPELLCLDGNATLEEAVRITAESEYSRFPVVVQQQGRDRVFGFVHGKDLYRHVAAVRPAMSLRQIVREPILIPETMTLDRLRRLMQRRRIHVAFVLDEYANFVGMASLEDVLEQLVGPIDDEQDEPEQQALLRRPDGAFEVDGAMGLPDAAARMDFEDPEEIGGIDTIGGYVFARLEHPPKVGDRVAIGRRHVAEVVAVEHFRVRRLLIRTVEPTPPPAQAEAEAE